MIKVRRYGKTVIVKFENGKWIQVDSLTILNDSSSMTSLTSWLISLLGKLFPRTKTPQFN
tara:strand:+ start:206 stop:385 length:180 start_codon:yes stop_codon:yes gene_type:complete